MRKQKVMSSYYIGTREEQRPGLMLPVFIVKIQGNIEYKGSKAACEDYLHRRYMNEEDRGKIEICPVMEEEVQRWRPMKNE